MSLSNGLNGANGLNGHHAVKRGLKPGIYAPIPTFFLPDSEDLGMLATLEVISQK